MILTRKIALGVAGVVAAGVLGTAGVAAATSSDSTPAPSASAAPSSTAPSADHPRAKHAKRAFLARGMHGEWVVKDKDGKPVTLATVRGTVTAVGSASVTVKAEDGFTATFATNSDTKVRGGADSLAEVKAGAKAAVVGVRSGSTTTARAVLVRK
jgi:hypothetical protein